MALLAIITTVTGVAVNAATLSQAPTQGQSQERPTLQLVAGLGDGV